MAKSTAENLTLLCRNVVDVIDKAELESRLVESAKQKRPLRIKAGFDPSAPDIHLGHAVLLRKLREFQDLGHKVIFIVGDYTARVGDPTGQSKTRPMLTKAQIEENAKTYQDQAFKILDSDPNKIEIVRNSQWLDGEDMFRIFFQKIGAMVTIDQLLERKDFDQRRKARRPIAVSELIYPMMQGYDSVAVKSDVELGGTDQKFNLLMGRDLQVEFGQRAQVVMTLPLLVGLDGSMKMSKSLGNTIAVNDTPKDIFGKVMSIPDAIMPAYFDLLTGQNGVEIERQILSGELHPRDAKIRLAKNLTAFFHGSDAAEKEAAEFDRIFKDRQNPELAEEVRVKSGELWIVDLLKDTDSAKTGADARRLIEQGAVELDGIRIQDVNAEITVKSGSLLRVGKKRFIKLVV